MISIWPGYMSYEAIISSLMFIFLSRHQLAKCIHPGIYASCCCVQTHCLTMVYSSVSLDNGSIFNAITDKLAKTKTTKRRARMNCGLRIKLEWLIKFMKCRLITFMRLWALSLTLRSSQNQQREPRSTQNFRINEANLRSQWVQWIYTNKHMRNLINVQNAIENSLNEMESDCRNTRRAANAVFIGRLRSLDCPLKIVSTSSTPPLDSPLPAMAAFLKTDVQCYFNNKGSKKKNRSRSRFLPFDSSAHASWGPSNVHATTSFMAKLNKSGSLGRFWWFRIILKVQHVPICIRFR